MIKRLHKWWNNIQRKQYVFHTEVHIIIVEVGLLHRNGRVLLIKKNKPRVPRHVINPYLGKHKGNCNTLLKYRDVH